MALTPHQIEKRKTSIGASEVAAIMNLDPFRTAHDVYWAKNYARHGVPAPEQKNTSGISLGNALETGLRKAAEESLGVKIAKGWGKRMKGHPYLSATPDGVIKGEPPIVVEIKYSSGFKMAWGGSGTDDVPDNYFLQCQTQMLVFGAQSAHLFALVGGEFRHHIILANAAIQDAILAHAQEFWRNHLEPAIPPADGQGCTLAPLDQLKRSPVDPGKVLQADEDLITAIAEWRDAKDLIKATEATCEELERKIIAASESAEEIHGIFGRVTRKSIKSNRVDLKALESKYPNIVNHFRYESISAPSLRFYPPKKGKG
jgi:putative phage-type endonuclease